ncbi:MAG: Flp pilus assembly complex ATPase component TadA [Thermoguttaceae bacterium]|nr:Flp pilus assembly complex ATPase component TadA [Thermoguttaceae bacterium]
MAKRRNFAAILVKCGLISQEQLEEAQNVASVQKIKLADALVQMEYVSANNVMRAMAEEYGTKFVKLEKLNFPADLVALVPEHVAREFNIVPVAAEDNELTIATSEPDDFITIDKLNFMLNRTISINLAPKEAIRKTINKIYGQDGLAAAVSLVAPAEDGAVDMTTEIDFSETDIYAANDDDGSLDESSAPIVRLAQLIITEAVQLKASDIHIEPFEDRIRIRYRIDGVLVERDSPPRRLLGALLSRFKILSKLDIAERRRTQDGRIKVTVGTKELDLRVSIIPTNHGQSVVMRILDKDNIKIGLRQLGFAEDDFTTFNTLIRRPNGIILVTGPTGSGKTTSLYAALNALNTPDRKIITAEDPVEYYLAGINQVEIKHQIGLDFASVIRSMLRQAPNIILVGEMRDLETAQMGIQASLTGHLVFSTLHTNDAPSAVTRLADMGVPSYLIASSVIAIMAQRLVRTICKKCREPFQPPQSVLESAGFPEGVLEKAHFMHGRGCSACNMKGYKGRLGIYELMKMSSKIRELTFAEAPTTQIRQAAITEGMKTLYVDGLLKVAKGITTLEEVLRVAKMSEEDG